MIKEVITIETEKILQDLEQAVSEFSKQNQFLQKELSNIDLELSDIYHYIEFSNLNACQGYKAYKLLKEILIRRRKIKNQINLFHSINESKLTTVAKGKIKTKMKKQNKLVYKPRIRFDLFTDKGDIKRL